jgi:alkanesulfonate monooxygenase SsuD/methylene tetrahydromethanopterin reductase-like flavin-dependent oxidoreductase (luciferase family)
MVTSLLRFDMRAPAFAKATPQELYAAALDMAAWADERFDAIVLSEHHATDDGYLPSPIALAGCMAGRTRRIRIGIVALLLPLYDPIRLAEDLAVLDLASGGRVGITAGLGYRPEEYAMFGRDWQGRGALMDEHLAAMLRAWRGEPFEFQGRPVRLSPLPATRPHPPVMVGGMGRNAARRAARFGLPFQPGVNTPEVLELYRSECRRLGVERPLVLPPGSGEMIWVSEDPDRSWTEIGPHLLHDATTYASWQPSQQRSAVHSEAKSVEALRSEGKYRILTPGECVERARAPFSVFVHFPLCGGMPPELGWRSLELYANEVLPRVG